MSTAAEFDNQNSFLEKIRREVAPGSETPRRKAEFPHVFASTDYRRVFQQVGSRNITDHQGLIDAFRENAGPLNLNVHNAETHDEAADIIIRIAETREPEFGTTRQIIQHVHPEILGLKLWQKLAGKPVALHTTYPEDPDLREKTISSYIGITAADWGIAESASLVQHTVSGRPRSTSLVPSIHIGLLPLNRLLANLEEVYCMIRRTGSLCSLTFISGPSKTADIEAHMVHGAHGPREMHVIVLAEQINI